MTVNRINEFQDSTEAFQLLVWLWLGVDMAVVPLDARVVDWVRCCGVWRRVPDRFNLRREHMGHLVRFLPELPPEVSIGIDFDQYLGALVKTQ